MTLCFVLNPRIGYLTRGLGYWKCLQEINDKVSKTKQLLHWMIFKAMLGVQKLEKNRNEVGLLICRGFSGCLSKDSLRVFRIIEDPCSKPEIIWHLKIINL
ncbi:hypothetical protein ACJX0J_027536, partial [Zea mays]